MVNFQKKVKFHFSNYVIRNKEYGVVVPKTFGQDLTSKYYYT